MLSVAAAGVKLSCSTRDKNIHFMSMKSLLDSEK